MKQAAKAHASALDRLIENAVGNSTPLGKADDPARTDFPELWRWLSECEAGRDHVKRPARLTIALGPEGVLVSLIDADLCCSIEQACSNLGSVFATMEQALTSVAPPIKTWGKKLPQLRKRKAGS